MGKVCWESGSRGYELPACAGMEGRKTPCTRACPAQPRPSALPFPSWRFAQVGTIWSTSWKGWPVGAACCLGPLGPLLLGAQLVGCGVTEQEGERNRAREAALQGAARKTLAFLGWDVGKGKRGPKAKGSLEGFVPPLGVN